MKIYVTTAGLGYNEKAFLLRLTRTNSKIESHDYLCIGLQNVTDNEIYKIGSVVKDWESFYVETTLEFDITESPLYGDFLFNYFIKNYKQIQNDI